MTTLNDFTPLQGGVPIVVDGQIVGRNWGERRSERAAGRGSRDRRCERFVQRLRPIGSAGHFTSMALRSSRHSPKALSSSTVWARTIRFIPAAEPAPARLKSTLAKQTSFTSWKAGATFVTGGASVDPKEIAPKRVPRKPHRRRRRAEALQGRRDCSPRRYAALVQGNTRRPSLLRRQVS